MFVQANMGGVETHIQSGITPTMTFSADHKASARIIFSHAFENVPNVVACHNYNYRNISIAVNLVSKTECTIYAFDASGNVSTLEAYWIATDY